MTELTAKYDGFPTPADLALLCAFGVGGAVLSAIGPALWSVPQGTAITASALTAALFMLLHIGARALALIRASRSAGAGGQPAPTEAPAGPDVAAIPFADGDQSRTYDADEFCIEPIRHLVGGDTRHFLMRCPPGARWTPAYLAALTGALERLEARLAGAAAASSENKIMVELPTGLDGDLDAAKRFKTMLADMPLMRGRIVLILPAGCAVREALRSEGLPCACRIISAVELDLAGCGIVFVDAEAVRELESEVLADTAKIFIVDAIESSPDAALLAARGFTLGAGEGTEFVQFEHRRAA